MSTVSEKYKIHGEYKAVNYLQSILTYIVGVILFISSGIALFAIMILIFYFTLP